MSAVPTASIDAAAEWLRTHFAPEAACGVRASDGWDRAGAEGAPLPLEIENGACLIASDRALAPAGDLRARVALGSKVQGEGETVKPLPPARRIQTTGDLQLPAELRSGFGCRV